MKRSLAVIPLLTLFALGLAAAPLKATVAGLTKDAKFDKKAVIVKAKVAKFQARTSRDGNPYYVFKLEDGGKQVSVYGHGKLPQAPKDGQTVEVTGLFAKERKLGTRTFKDEIDTSPVKGQKYGVTLISVAKAH